MTAKELKVYLADVPDTMQVHLICDGRIDENPELNVCDDILYIEGITKGES